MANRKSTLGKVYRAAILSFENAVRLHDDAILLLTEGRSASGVYMSALAMEEIGKYFLYEDIWFYNNTGSEWTEEQIEDDIPEIHDWLATPEFEAHFVDAWPNMTAQARQGAREFRKLADDAAD